MPGKWGLGGLSLCELLKRTVKESWQDDVFGQAGRLAFYHFLAVFPAFLLLLIPLARLSRPGAQMREALLSAFRQFLPQNAAELVAGAIQDLDKNAHAGGALLVVATLSAIWAGINASWAMIVGLNTAYETQDDRDWLAKAKVAAGLALALFVLVFAALAAAHFFGRPSGSGSRERDTPYTRSMASSDWYSDDRFRSLLPFWAQSTKSAVGMEYTRRGVRNDTVGSFDPVTPGVFRQVRQISTDLWPGVRYGGADDLVIHDQRHCPDRRGAQFGNRESA